MGSILDFDGPLGSSAPSSPSDASPWPPTRPVGRTSSGRTPSSSPSTRTNPSRPLRHRRAATSRSSERHRTRCRRAGCWAPASAATGGTRTPDRGRWRTERSSSSSTGSAMPGTASDRTTSTSPTASDGTSASSDPAAQAAPRASRRRSSSRCGRRHARRRARRSREPLALPWRRPPNVLVLDTGLATSGGRPAHDALHGHCLLHRPWLDRATGRFNDEDEPDDDARGRLDRQAGHGTFISGVVRQICPTPRIHHAGVLSSYGDGDDASVTNAIERALRRFRQRNEHIDIVVMSFGSYAEADRPPPMAQRSAGCCGAASSSPRRATTRRPGRATRPRCPASSASGPWTPTAAACSPTSVHGSTPRRRASMSSARSSPSSTTTTPNGACLDQYRGWASWSGTSFAAPKVAGGHRPGDVPARHDVPGGVDAPRRDRAVPPPGPRAAVQPLSGCGSAG